VGQRDSAIVLGIAASTMSSNGESRFFGPAEEPAYGITSCKYDAFFGKFHAPRLDFGPKTRIFGLQSAESGKLNSSDIRVTYA
jgi:hypothetical protein